MKLLLSIFSVAILSLIFQIVLPWWTLAIAAFIIGIILDQSAFTSFLGGLLGCALIWAVYALYLEIDSGSVLSQKIATILSMKSSSLLIVIAAAIVGLVGGLSSLAANMMRSSFK